MKGDEKIDGEIKALNDASMAFATLIEKMRSKLNRDWEVQIDDGGTLQQSYFIASEKDVKLVLRRQDVGGTLHTFDVFEDGYFRQYSIPATLVSSSS
jgi:hypothetical protein